VPLSKMIELVDQLGNHFQVDSSLQVVVDGHVGYIEENAHTFAGRMHIYFPHLGHDMTQSLSDIDPMTDEARGWITGFLAGSEPGIYEYLGTQWLDSDDQPDPTEDEWARWREFTATFRRTGYCPWLGRRPVTPLVITDDELSELRVDGELTPWVLAGERVWVPAGQTWTEADPQPTLVRGQWPGTVCAERGHPELTTLDSGWSICIDCGELNVN
jgi:hypothetical protein